jgi:hypothetical protein
MTDIVDITRSQVFPSPHGAQPLRLVEASPAVRRSGPPSGSVDLDEDMLVVGYLSAVAALLDQRGLTVRALDAKPRMSVRSAGA